MDEKDLKKALEDKALGFDCDEIVEEYSTDKDGTSYLCKRKITKKHNPPDLSALKFLLEQNSFDKEIDNMTDGELQTEFQRLLQLLKEKEKKK